MQIKLIILVILLISVKAQAQHCPLFHDAIMRGNNFVTVRKYDLALDEFRMAKTLAKECEISAALADKGIRKVYDAIKKERDKAVKIRDTLRITLAALDIKQRQLDSTQAALDSVIKIINAYAQYQQKDTNNAKALTGISENNENAHLEKALQDSSMQRQPITADPPAAKTALSTVNGDRIEFADLSFVEFKKSFDSFINVGNKNTDPKFAIATKEPLIRSLEKSLNNSITGDEYARHLYDSSHFQINRLHSQLKQIPDDLLMTYLRAGLYYGWKLIDEKKLNKVQQIINETESIVDKAAPESAEIYFGLAGFENLQSRLESENGNKTSSYNHSLNAIQLSLNAVRKDPFAIYNKKSLAINLRNMDYVSDSILTREQKDNYLELNYELVDFLLNSPDNTGDIFWVVSKCATERANNLLQSKKEMEAVEVLTNTIEKVNSKIKSYPNEYANFLINASLYCKIASIFDFYIKDKEKQNEHTSKAFDSWMNVVTGDTIFQTALSRVVDVYDNLVTNFDDCFDTTEQTNAYLKIADFINPLAQHHPDIFEIAYISTTANLAAGELLMERKLRPDSVAALDYFDKSVASFKNGISLDRYTAFTEDFSKFCKPFVDRISINISLNNFENVANDYSYIKKVFFPIYKQYSYDFYLGQGLVKASRQYGRYMAEKKKYAEAIPALEFASFEGNKESTIQLVDIYKNPTSGFADNTKLAIVKKRAGNQSSSMKLFTVQTLFGTTNYPFDVYVVDRDSSYPYKGIEDQAEWVKVARGGVIGEEVRNAFIKLQDLAWKNNVSFTELCSYAFKPTDDQKILEKYITLKSQINDENDTRKKQLLYNNLYTLYEHDIKQDLTNKKIIKKDAVVLYNQYADFLSDNNFNAKAISIYKRVLQLNDTSQHAITGLSRLLKVEFNNSKSIQVLTQSRSLEELKIILGFCLQDKKNDEGVVVSKMLALKNDAATRDIISYVYWQKTNDPNFESLFLSDKKNVREFREYYMDNDLSNDSSSSYKRIHYLNLIKLDEVYLTINHSTKIKKEIAQHYNSLAWYCLLTQKFGPVLSYLQKSKAYDPSYLYPVGNMPHAYLFANEFEKAKAMYLKLKDQPFDPSGGYPTFKDSFLSDFQDFENAGIKNDHIKEIINLLNK